jgi:predicted nucleotidyltransferase
MRAAGQNAAQRHYVSVEKSNSCFADRINSIKESILKFVPAKRIYLFGSHAYGKPHGKSDIDIYLVTADEVQNFSELYANIIGDLSDKKIYFVDLLLNTENSFNARKTRNILEETVFQKGKIIYEA